MLKSLKVEKLVISAIPDLVDTWTLGFGFELVEEEEMQSLSKTNLMVFPGAVWLKKMLYDNHSTDERNSELYFIKFSEYFICHLLFDFLLIQIRIMR